MNILRTFIGGGPSRRTAPTQQAPVPKTGLVPKKRTILTDQEWVQDVHDERFLDHIFQRVSAKKIRFANVDFRYSTFDSCYLRTCTFDSCNFTGVGSWGRICKDRRSRAARSTTHCSSGHSSMKVCLTVVLRART